MRIAPTFCIITILGIIFPALQALAIDPDIRFYKANKRLQQDRILDFGKGDEPGCHDFLKSTRVHRVANYGYKYCVLYAERNCLEGSEMSVRWKEDAETKVELTQGARWFPVREDIRGSKVGSWNCIPLESGDTATE
jgi:hypothetical protein